MITVAFLVAFLGGSVAFIYSDLLIEALSASKFIFWEGTNNKTLKECNF